MRTTCKVLAALAAAATLTAAAACENVARIVSRNLSEAADNF